MRMEAATLQSSWNTRPDPCRPCREHSDVRATLRWTRVTSPEADSGGSWPSRRSSLPRTVIASSTSSQNSGSDGRSVSSCRRGGRGARMSSRPPMAPTRDRRGREVARRIVIQLDEPGAARAPSFEWATMRGVSSRSAGQRHGAAHGLCRRGRGEQQGRGPEHGAGPSTNTLRMGASRSPGACRLGRSGHGRARGPARLGTIASWSKRCSRG